MSNKLNLDRLKTNKIQEFEPLDDVFFKPSDKVWLNVHKEIRKKKRHRKGLILFMLTGSFALSLLFICQQFQAIQKTEYIQPSANHLEIGRTNQESNFSRIHKSETSNGNNEKGARTESTAKNKKEEQIRNSNYSGNSNSHKSLVNDTQVKSKDVATNKLRDYYSTKNQIAPRGLMDSLIDLKNLTPYVIEGSERDNWQYEPLKKSNDLKFRLNYERKSIDKFNVPKLNSSRSKSFINYIGLELACFPVKYHKDIEVSSLSETVSSSIYDRTFGAGIQFEKSITRKFALVFNPGYRQDQLLTKYDLNIPYDYNTEEKLPTININHFTHSLPTDFGNIRTNMTVSRAKNSSVGHNELVNIEFQARQMVSTLSLPVGLKYYFKKFKSGFSTTIFAATEIVLSRRSAVDKFLSHHSLVHGDHVEINPEFSSYKYRFNPGMSLQYKYQITNSWSTEIGVGYARNLSNLGRNQMLNLGISIGKSLR